jgi:hypothetical protein
MRIYPEWSGKAVGITEPDAIRMFDFCRPMIRWYVAQRFLAGLAAAERFPYELGSADSVCSPPPTYLS